MRVHLIPPTDEEDRIITEAALADPDALPLTDEELAQFKKLDLGVRAFKLSTMQVPVTIPLDADVLTALLTIGPNWQKEVNNQIRVWLRSRSDKVAL